MHGVGIDFGTTNSAIAVASARGAARILPLPSRGDAATSTWRTVLCFEPADDGVPMRVTAGAPGLERYWHSEGSSRLLQSIKSHLASASFSDTIIFGRRFRIEELVAVFLRELRTASGVTFDGPIVVGRPVRYWGADDEADEARAVERMHRALAAAGFAEVELVYEPVAAAHRYASRLDHRELVVIADFGGGTSDFSLVEVGAGLARVRGNSGIALAGDAFDGRIIDHAVAPWLGRGGSYLAEMGGKAPVPAWIYSRLRRWHHLSFLRTAETVALIQRVRQGAVDRAAIDRLWRIIDEDLGLPLHGSVEAVKLGLSRAPAASLRFDRAGGVLDQPIARADFDAWIEEELGAIDRAVDELLEAGGVGPGDIDRVFTTGGSSLVPAVQARLAARFGREKLVGGEELTSVAAGLAEAALAR